MGSISDTVFWLWLSVACIGLGFISLAGLAIWFAAGTGVLGSRKETDD